MRYEPCKRSTQAAGECLTASLLENTSRHSALRLGCAFAGGLARMHRQVTYMQLPGL